MMIISLLLELSSRALPWLASRRSGLKSCALTVEAIFGAVMAHWLANDQLGFCTWSLLTTAGGIRAEPAVCTIVIEGGALRYSRKLLKVGP